MTDARFGAVGDALDRLFYSIEEAKDAVEDLRRLALPTAFETNMRLDDVADLLTQAQEIFRETEPCDDAFDDEAEDDSDD